jgi:multiple sugar transport system substrate-binding protein
MKRQAILVTLLLLTAGALFATGGQETTKGATITFWMQNYGADLNAQKTAIGDLAAKFEKETGIKVQLEVNNWTEASQKWMLVVTGGDHPDVGDMFWAWSNVRIGKGKYGPMPLDKYKEQLHHERFYEKALADVIYDGHVYGIPWRIDVRPMLYRADLVAEAGFKGPPDTWDDLVTYGK